MVKAWLKNEWWLWTFRFPNLFMQCTFPPILVKKIERKKSPGTNGLNNNFSKLYTCHGNSPGIALTPPTIFATPDTPHWQPRNIHSTTIIYYASCLIIEKITILHFFLKKCSHTTRVLLVTARQLSVGQLCPTGWNKFKDDAASQLAWNC